MSEECRRRAFGAECVPIVINSIISIIILIDFIASFVSVDTGRYLS